MKKLIHTMTIVLALVVVFSSSADAFSFGGRKKDNRNPADYDKRTQVMNTKQDPYRSLVALNIISLQLSN